MLLRFLLILLLLPIGLAQANLSSQSSSSFGGLFGTSSSQAKFLPVHEAFRPGIVAADDQQIRLQFDITPEYYLYRHRLKFELEGGDASIAAVNLPDGLHKTDEFFGDVEVYYDRLEVLLDITSGSRAPQSLRVEFQLRRCRPVLSARDRIDSLQG